MNQSPALKIEDLKTEAEFYLTRKAKAALEKKATNQTAQNEKGEIFLCLYVACKVPKNELDDGIKMVAAKVNQFAQKDLIHSALSHFVHYDLNVYTTQEQETIVMCYILVPEKIHKKLMKSQTSMLKKKQRIKPGDPNLVGA
jgi:hypothetical protein